MRWKRQRRFDNVMVIDSGQLSSGMGLIVLYAISCAAGGMGAGDIVQKLKAYKKQIQTSFIVSETGYLMQAGKISEKVHKLCQAFMLHPVVVLKNGRMKIKKNSKRIRQKKQELSEKAEGLLYRAGEAV